MSEPGGSQVTARFRRLARDGTLHIVGGSLVAGLGVYAYQIVGARALGADGFAPVVAVLTIHFLAFMIVLVPVEQFLIRRLTISEGARGTGRSVAIPVIGVGMVAALIGGFFALATAERNFNGIALYALAVAAIILTHTVFVVSRAYLAGRRRFADYGVASAAASLARLALTIPLVIVAASGLGLAWIMAAAPLVVLAWRPFAAAGRPPPITHDETPGRFLTGFILASAASQALILAGPLAARYVGADNVAVSVVYTTLTLFRAPIAFGYNLIARVLPPFTRLARAGDHEELRRTTILMTTVGAALTPVALAAGYLLGPAIVAAIFGAEFRPGSGFAALVAGGVVVAGTSLFVGQVLVARGETGRLATAWLAAVGAAALALALSGWAPETRVAAAFLVGEIAALAAIVAGVLVPGRRNSPA
jgi:O-antigen/teichoic acid export membrane protein